MESVYVFIGIVLFILELCAFVVDCVITEKIKGEIIRVGKFIAYLGMFTAIFTIWLYTSVIEDCVNSVNVYMLFGLIITFDIISVLMVFIRLNRVYSYLIVDNKIIAYRLFFKYTFTISDIDRVERKSDGFRLVLKNGKSFMVEYMFEKLDILLKMLNEEGIINHQL